MDVSNSLGEAIAKADPPDFARLAERVAEQVSAFPPLTDEQADRIAAILRNPIPDVTPPDRAADDLAALRHVREDIP